MEKFEIIAESGLEAFASFASKTNTALTDLTKDIKSNIKKYEKNIDTAEKDIADAVSSREKCEEEIAKMQDNIKTIKEAIENVQNTFKSIETAYASTSVGDTKNIYSDVISEAKANCEKDVEKNRTEIAKLNSDIESIKNNIKEFDHTIETLNTSLDTYKLELSKYEKTSDYFEKMLEKTKMDLGDIEESKLPKSKSAKKTTKQPVIEEVIEENKVENDNSEFSNPVLDALEVTNSFTIANEPKQEEPKESNQFDNIFDFTGNNNFGSNLENLFSTPSEDVKEEVSNEYKDSDMSEWESILNGNDNLFDLEAPEEPNIIDLTGPINIPGEVKKETPVSNEVNEVNELLKPYNTTFDELKSNAGALIKYKDGKEVEFNVSMDDVKKAVNTLGADDLRRMKIVGPNITILRRIKAMKEGK